MEDLRFYGSSHRSVGLDMAECECQTRYPRQEVGRPLSMKTPKRLQPLVEEGIIDEVISPLMSGKEADVFIVRSSGNCAAQKSIKTR